MNIEKRLQKWMENSVSRCGIWKLRIIVQFTRLSNRSGACWNTAVRKCIPINESGCICIFLLLFLSFELKGVLVKSTKSTTHYLLSILYTSFHTKLGFSSLCFTLFHLVSLILIKKRWKSDNHRRWHTIHCDNCDVICAKPSPVW